MFFAKRTLADRLRLGNLFQEFEQCFGKPGRILRDELVEAVYMAAGDRKRFEARS